MSDFQKPLVGLSKLSARWERREDGFLQCVCVCVCVCVISGSLF